MFKKRFVQKYKKPSTIIFGNGGLFTYYKFRYEFIYFRVLKKIIRRKYIKRDMRFMSAKFWIYLTPNHTLSKKPKNARMGAGVGSYIRVSCVIGSGQFIINTYNYSKKNINTLATYLLRKNSNTFGVLFLKNLKIGSN